MAPNETNNIQARKLPPFPPGDEIVISGIAGRFPASINMQEFKDNLMEKRDMVSDDDRRWSAEFVNAPHRIGKVDNINKFDTLFFGIHPKQAHAMDPMSRMVLEHTYEAIVDAGLNPNQLRGTNTGVFIGTCYNESEKTWFYEKVEPSGFGIIGCSRAMMANRISYWLNLSGPSYTLDTACSSSLYAMENGYRAIRDGIIDNAIVAGANLCLLPTMSMHFHNLGVLSTDGRCKTWDKDADGYVRSEASCVVLLQKAKNAKRIYAKVVHSRVNSDGYKEEGVTFPSSLMQAKLLRQLYAECGVPTSQVSYVEAHGTGTRAGDPEEIVAIDKVIAHDRSSKSPLLIGSVKSNLGHTEPASGIVSLAKVLLAMESSTIPPNINFKECRPQLEAIVKGRMKIVTEPTEWTGKYASINNFGFGGANSHILLERNPKDKVNNGAPNDDLPRLVTVSGRTEEAVAAILQYLESRPVDVDFVGLMHNIHSDNISGHLYRGYTLLPPRGIAESPIQAIKSFNKTRKPVWFVFSGMGSQWPGMGEALLSIPVFAEAIKTCDAVLKPLGIDIFHVLTNKEKSAFDVIINSFVGIAAIQIGLVDLLKSLGIEPDNIIGHSVGELGCAYADGCFTAEQMILSAYSRGLASVETELVKGSMAAVALGYKDIQKLCLDDIEVACHNSAESSTVSGPAESIKKFVAELTAKKIFAKEVPCSGIAYHSRYIADAGPKLLAYLKKVIPDPKPRSNKWVSSSIPMDKWNTDLARYSSAEYHTNNLLSSVLFEETSTLIPQDAVTIEIAPHGLLQAILKRSLAPSVINIPMTQRGHKDNVEIVFQAVGKIFNEGLQPRLDKLYPPITFPVGRSTPMISPLIKWEHSDDWFVTKYKSDYRMGSGERDVNIDIIEDKDYQTLSGHIIDGRNLFPATGYLTLIWETYGMMRGLRYSLCSVVFEDVKFLRATTIPKNGVVKFVLMIQKGTGRFEVIDGNTAVVTGLIRGTSHPEEEKVKRRIVENNEEESLTSRDVYKELRLRGYQYSGRFRSITKATISGAKAHISWHNDWIAFMDNMLQIKILGYDTRGLFVPTGIKKIVIDTKAHYQQIQQDVSEPEFEVTFDKLHDAVVSGGVEILGLNANAITRRKPAGDAVIEEYKFVPFSDGACVSLREMARLATHIGMENSMGIKVKTVELLHEADEEALENLLSPWISESLGNLPLVQADVRILTTKSDFEQVTLPANVSLVNLNDATKDSNALLAIGHGLLTDDRNENLHKLLSELKPGGFLLSRETDVKGIENAAQHRGLHVIMIKKVANETFVLLRKREKLAANDLIVNVCNDKFDWVETMRKIMTKELEKGTTDNTRIFLVGQGDIENGLVGLVNCMKQEPGGELIRGVLIQDLKAPAFSLQNPIYAQQVQKDLTICVLRENGIWGTYRHLPLSPIKPEPVQHCYVKQMVRGDLSSLAWIEGTIRPELNQKNLVNICYASLNFKDIMLASGKLAVETAAKTRQAENCVIGFEYSGTDNTNKKVMGMIEYYAMSNLCIPDSNLTWEIPQNWNLVDAATVPCVYATCIYALYMKSRIRKGHKILIHAGTGGIGQAAINLALSEGCEVFTTVGTPEKRKFIRDNFPQIRDDHIGNSRDISFEQMIKEQTDGYGVDFVLNSLSEDKLLASVRCLAWGGHFLEIGKFDLSADNPLGMNCFLREVSFHGVMLDRLFEESEEKKSELKLLFEKYLKTGAIKPLVRTVFPYDQVQAAFRYMASGKHIGKVMIKVCDENDMVNSKPSALPQYYCLENRSYIILGGLGGFGLELADWLVLRGAKNLVITSRTGIKNGYQKMRLDLWKSYGVNVTIVSGKEASSQQDCRHIVETAVKLGPVDAVFNLAVLLKDALWDNQTAETFEESFRPKAWATKNLDVITRKLCPQLRHFVVFSSVSCGRGNAGQTNYGMSNSVMERICEKRVADGLPGLAIQWGAIGDVGLVADMQENDKELVIGGTLQQRISSCLQELDGFLHRSQPIVSSMVVAEKRAGSGDDLTVTEAILNILGLKDLNSISLNATLAEMGMDSMMAVEIKQTLERNYEIFLNAQDIRNLTFVKLQEISTMQQSDNTASDSNAMEDMRMLIRIVDNMTENQDISLKLRTMEETGRDEIFLIPGIEGFSYVFANVAPHLKAPATCLQMGIRNNNFDSIVDMASFFLPYVLHNSKIPTTMTLVGYSYGALIALELSRLLEEKKISVRLILIDGAPEQAKGIITHGMSHATLEELQNQTFTLIAQLVATSDIVKFTAGLTKCKNWNEKLELFVQSISFSKLGMTADDQRNFCTSMYRRILAVVDYDPAPLKTMTRPITLIKPTSQSFKTNIEDYGLSKLTNGPIDIHYVTGDHVSVMENDKVASIINEIK